MLASLDRLAALGDIDVALPGHGRPITEVAAVIADARRGFERRLDETRAAVRRGPAGAYEITTRMFGDEPDLEATGHLTEVLSYLKHLRRRGEVVRETDAAGRYRYRAARPNGGSS